MSDEKCEHGYTRPLYGECGPSCLIAVSGRERLAADVLRFAFEGFTAAAYAAQNRGAFVDFSNF